MKVNLVFEGVPGFVKSFGKKAFEFDLRGQTVADLVAEFIHTHGEGLTGIHEFLKLIPSFLIVINQKDYVLTDRMAETQLKEGDTVFFVILLDGG